MRFLFCILLMSFLLSCENKKKLLTEDFQAIGYDGQGNEIGLGDGVFMTVPKLKFILFTYHDSIFKVEIDRQDTPHYGLLKCDEKAKDSLRAFFKTYQKTTLKKQLDSIQKNGFGHNCFSDGYFLFDIHEKTSFGLFDFMDYHTWKRHCSPKEMTLRADQFPKIYETIYHTFNSKWRDYSMSNDYHYKDIRTHQ